MAPELVVAAAPFKLYPGGVIAFKCSEWLGDSAGASVESDARAIEGEVVRETQQTSNVLLTGLNKRTAVAAADDTLTIDLSGIPFSATSQNDPGVTLPFFYDVFMSVVIEGTWNASDTGTYDHTPLRFDRACLVALFGDAFNPVDSPQNHIELGFYPHGADSHYTMIGFNSLVYIETGEEVLHVQALVRDTSTIEILLDQLVLVPTAGGSSGMDNYIIAGGENTPATAMVDGADGGDVNGKFTWHPRRLNTEPVAAALIGSNAGGGDYQQEDSEYMVDVPAADGYVFAQFDGETEQLGHLYSLHGAYYRESQIHETDPFTRTVAGSFGTSPRGYPYSMSFGGSNATPSVDGTRGKIHFTGVIPRANGLEEWKLNLSPKMRAENMSFSGDFEVKKTTGSGAWWDGVTTEVTVLIAFMWQSGSEGPALGIIFDVINERWRMAAFDKITEAGAFQVSYPHTTFSDWIDISGWFALASLVGWRLELKRYLIRARIWDATGAEPSTWDFEDFHPIDSGASLATPVWETYPYSDDVDVATRRLHTTTTDWWHEVEPFVMTAGVGYTAQWDAYYDNVVFESDPYGDIVDVHALVESPKNTEIDRIQIPSGAWHFVYWGNHDFTTLTDLGGPELEPALDFAIKVWNDAGAAELQRSEMPFAFFLWQLAGNIVSMNWREADRSGEATRVLVGGSGR